MSALTRMAAKISTTEMLEANDPLDVLREASTTVALGPMSVEVQPGVSNQELRMFGTQGLFTCKSLIITSDASVTISYEGTAPIPLAADGFHAMSGTTLSTITVTNATADIAHLTLWLAGVEFTPPNSAGVFTLTGISVTLTADISTTCTAVSSGLVNCWDMNETTGTRVDHVGGKDLTMVGTVAGIAGQIKNAAEFTGSSSNYLRNTAYTFALGPSAFTIAFWVKLTSRATNQMIITQGITSGAGNYLWLILALVGGQIEAAFDGASAGVIFSSTVLPLNAWTFVVIWHDGVNLRLQQNNSTIDSTAAIFHNNGGAANLVFGAVGAGNQPLSGLVDSTQIWNRVLTLTERGTVWNSGVGV